MGNGAHALIQTLVNAGVDTCFTNPGTSEMHFVAALDEVEGMRCVLCLFEGVLSGAADGYARMAGKPASVPGILTIRLRRSSRSCSRRAASV